MEDDPSASRNQHTVAGKNSAPVDIVNVPLFTGGAGFLPSTVIPENWPLKRNVVSQSLCFRGELLVSESANVVHKPPICWVGPFTISFGV